MWGNPMPFKRLSDHGPWERIKRVDDVERCCQRHASLSCNFFYRMATTRLIASIVDRPDRKPNWVSARLRPSRARCLCILMAITLSKSFPTSLSKQMSLQAEGDSRSFPGLGISTRLAVFQDFGILCIFDIYHICIAIQVLKCRVSRKPKHYMNKVIEKLFK